jgi:hypothetical protein
MAVRSVWAESCKQSLGWDQKERMTFPGDVTFTLYVGTYKTATSTIQTLLARNRDVLGDRYGILYPKTGARRNTGAGDPNSQAHHTFFHVLRQDNTPPDPARIAVLRDDLAAEIAESGQTNVILCTELFSNAPLGAKQAFVDMLRGARVRVIHAVRRADEYIESMANQSHKNFRTTINAPARTLKTARHLADWAQLVGRDQLHVHAFSKSDYPGYLQRMFQSLGVGPEDALIDPTLHDNPAMTLTGFLMRRTVMYRLAALNTDISRPLTHQLNLALDTLEHQMPHSPKAIFLTPQQRRRIMRANAEDARAIAGYMSPGEALLFEGELNLPVAETMPNIAKTFEIDHQTLDIICRGFASGTLGKMLKYASET